MHIRLREVPLRILTTEKTTWIASTHVIFHKTLKLFWKIPLQQAASKQQQKTLKGFLWSTHRACGARKFPANSHFCVCIFFFIPRCHEKELIGVFKLPTWNARVPYTHALILLIHSIYATLYVIPAGSTPNSAGINHRVTSGTSIAIFTITAEILARSLANFYCQ